MRLEIDWAGRPLVLEAGRLARQANGSVLVRYGGTVVLVTATASPEPVRLGFLPLTVEYQEMTYAAGRIPGGFFKREGRPTEKEIVTARCIDRPIRPLFPKGYRHEVQVIATVLSVDDENEPEVLALIGASAALHLSDIPFDGPIAGARVGRIDGQFVCNPTATQAKLSDLELLVAGNRHGVVMVEGEAYMLPEQVMVEAIAFGQEHLGPILDLEEELREQLGRPKVPFQPPQVPLEIQEFVAKECQGRLREALLEPSKQERQRRQRGLLEEIAGRLPGGEESPEVLEALREAFEEVLREEMRRLAFEGRRVDGRAPEQVRPITCEVGLLPGAHGSALFSRGETQVLAATTLGTSSDEQKIEDLFEEEWKSFMVHYNFPPFCVGEVKPLRGPSRREIGHGSLAERALRKVLPSSEEFPYTIRVVSEVLESNGSSSMATVCGGSLSLMDAGVPVKAAVGGIALGLITEGNRHVILTDILGDEDRAGDMDLKVAGTAEGVTALQMDIKVHGLSLDLMSKALQRSREARLHVLECMNQILARPRPEVSERAPRITLLRINPDKIRDLIGPGGKHIRSIVNETGAKIEVEDDGKVTVASKDLTSLERAVEMVRQLTQEVELGRVYIGKVKRVMDYGALVEIFPGTSGLLHITNMGVSREVRDARKVIKEGEEVVVRVIEVEEDGKIRLARRDVTSPTRAERSREHGRREGERLQKKRPR